MNSPGAGQLASPHLGRSETRQLRVALVTHVALATGLAHWLATYLRRRVQTFAFIEHPFADASLTHSRHRSYDAGALARSAQSQSSLPFPFRHAQDVLRTWWWLGRGPAFDLYIGCDGLNALAGLFLRRLGRVRRVVFYTIDFVPQRFGNPVLNALYHWIDRFCLKHCDQVWNVSPRMAEGRARHGVAGRRTAPQFVVPGGVHYQRMKELALALHDPNDRTIAFLGHIAEQHGVQLALAALPEVLRAVPDARLMVIGSGPYEPELRRLTAALGMEGHVDFLGYVEDHREVEKRLASSSIGLATYTPDPDNFSYYADPGKIKNYLAAGLPVITTDVPHIAREVEREQCGVIVDYSANALAGAIIRLLSDRPLLETYRANALRFAAQFDWDAIFDRALCLALGDGKAAAALPGRAEDNGR